MPGPDSRPIATWRRGYDLLRSQGLGVVCGLATVVLLALGSVVMAATHDTLSSGIALDDIKPFFTRPSLVHAWFYLLIPVLSLYALSTLLATWHSVLHKWRNGQRRLAVYGPSVVHLSFLIALVAHLIGGIWAEELGPVMLDSRFKPLPDGREARLVDLQLENLPSGALKRAIATVEWRAPDGRSGTEEVGYNQPLSSGAGSTLFLLLRQSKQIGAVVLEYPGGSCELERGETPCRVGRYLIQAADIRDIGSHAHPMARLVVREQGKPPREQWITPGREVQLDASTALKAVRFEQRAVVLLRGRRAPGNPVAMASAVVLLLGLLMMWRRFVPRRLGGG